MNRTNINNIDPNKVPHPKYLYSPPTDISDHPLLYVQVPPVIGASGAVHHATASTVIKFAHRTEHAWEYLIHEAVTYQILQQNGICSIPEFYGLFVSQDDFALVLSNEGKALEDFSQLSEQQRQVF